MNELISVIVPVYNVEEYIEQCVNSIRAQTYTNLEIILVDDGSKDSSGLICDKLAQEDARIHVIHKPNGGVSSARNAGLDYAHGEYIAFVDGDDYIDATMYEKLLYKMDEDTDIVFCYLQRFYPDGKVRYYNDSYEFFLEEPWDVSPILCRGGYLNGEEVHSIDCSACRSLYKNLLLKEYRVRFEEKVKTNEDELFLMEYLSVCNRAALIKECLYHYRKDRKESVSTFKSIEIEMDYEHEKNKWLLRKNIVSRSFRLPSKKKKLLLLFLGHEYYYNFSRRQIVRNSNYKEILRRYNKDPDIKEIRESLSISNLRQTGRGLKRMIFVKMCQYGLFSLVHFLNKGCFGAFYKLIDKIKSKK